MNKLVALIFACVSIFSLPVFAAEKQIEEGQVTLSFAPMLEKVMPAVVNIAVQGEISSNDGQTNARKFESLGSGVIIDPKNGFLVTSEHVVRNAKLITVTLNDGRRLKAKAIGTDAESDLAVLQIKAKEKLYPIAIGNSNELQVGDFVIAIGNPFGLNTYGANQTATFGIVSALQRSDLNNESLESYIQTDAAINPGNSGGALVNSQGELVGINTAIISTTGGSQGIGFAIPINVVQSIMQQIITYGSVSRGLMGVYVQQLTPELADALGAKGAVGALVSQVNKASPAERAGLQTGDIIQAVNGQLITDANQLRNYIRLMRVGTKVNLKILRNGRSINLNAAVADQKKHEEQLQSRNPFLYGLTLRDFTQMSPVHGLTIGVQVVSASENSQGYRAGIRSGDVIISANHSAVKTIDELNEQAEQVNEQLLIHLTRNAASLYIVIQ